MEAAGGAAPEQHVSSPWLALLLDWLTSLLAWAVVIAFVVVVYAIGRHHGRMAERKRVEAVAVELVPQQRAGER
jgi:tetrahydromethanopterin S-methyltransferase subunit E